MFQLTQLIGRSFLSDERAPPTSAITRCPPPTNQWRAGNGLQQIGLGGGILSSVGGHSIPWCPA